MVYPPDKADNIDMFIQNSPIKRVDHFKYLGVVIDNHLKWTGKIDYLYQKVITFVNIF